MKSSHAFHWQAPACLTLTPASVARHSLMYVLPSHPHAAAPAGGGAQSINAVSTHVPPPSFDPQSADGG
jgi:hypothetical protein